MSRHLEQWILAAMLSLSLVFALNPHVNISISETVHQNVSFAKDFYLVENRTYNLIEGILIITNPGSETTFDTYIKVINTDNLATNIIYSSGRNGSQMIYPKNTAAIVNYTNDISSSFTSLGRDIDEDGTNDSVRVNSTHIIFNVTSEYKLLAYQLYNTSGAADLSGTQVFNSSYVYNITSVKIDGNYNDGVVFANFTINGTETTVNMLNATQLQMVLTDTKRNYSVLHVPELRQNQQTVFVYNVSSLMVEPPLDINTSYTHQPFQTKVLAGQIFNVTDSATNIATVGNLTIVNITITALSVNVSNGSVSQLFNFSLENLQATGDYVFVTGNGTNNKTWIWVTNNGSIPVGQTFNISYSVRAPTTVPTSGTYAAVRQDLFYNIGATASRLGIDSVRARSEVNFTTSKQVIGPQDNTSSRNVTWQSLPAVGTYLNITFTLEKVTLWVTSTLDPNIVVGDLNTTYTPSQQINQTVTWAGSAWLFNFTDGSDSVTAPPPIVWIKPYWIITNTGGQILNQSITQNGTDIYIKYIYVVNGYWLEVNKNVTSTANNSYDIRVWVHNRGNGHTPQNLTVTVYDFIQSNFVAYGFSPAYNNASNVSGQFSGVAYQWDVGLRTNLSTSFAPEGDPSNLDEFYMSYTVNGTGDFKVSDLYIVGLDPRSVDGAGTHEGISVLSGIASTSKELVYAAIVLFLIAINIGNFLMTSRINKKLDKKE